jgi:hypothetical protein
MSVEVAPTGPTISEITLNVARSSDTFARPFKSNYQFRSDEWVERPSTNIRSQFSMQEIFDQFAGLRQSKP